jgi:hypothetical protein
MTIKNDLELLAKHHTSENNQMLSIYLRVEPSRTGFLSRSFESELLVKLRSIQRGLPDGIERRNFRASVKRVKHFLATHKPTGQGLILFCNAQDNFLWWRELKVPVPNEVHWNRHPHIRPLLELQDQFERYCIILSDRERGHLFTVFMGEIEQHLELVSSAEVKHSKKSGSDHIRSQMQFQRKADLHALWHLKRIVKLAERQMSLCPYDRLILAGPCETTGALQRLLPKSLKSRVVGSVSLPVQATLEQILDATLKIEQRVEQEAETHLAEDLVVSASKGPRAVTGLAATLLALNNGAVWKLVYAQDSNVPGKRCALCDRLYVMDRFSCGNCNEPLEPVDDLIELMVERLVKTGRRVEQVRGKAAQHLANVDGIGAFLQLRGHRPRQPHAKALVELAHAG